MGPRSHVVGAPETGTLRCSGIISASWANAAWNPVTDDEQRYIQWGIYGAHLIREVRQSSWMSKRQGVFPPAFGPDYCRALARSQTEI